MEIIENGKIRISKGKNFIVAELEQTYPKDYDEENKLYDFIDGLLGKGYELVDSGKSDVVNQFRTIDRWVLKTPK